MWDLTVNLYPSAPPLIQVRGKPATNQPLKQGYIVTKCVRIKADTIMVFAVVIYNYQSYLRYNNIP